MMILSDNLPIFQPQDVDGNPVGPAFTSWELAWDAADRLGLNQVTDILWEACIFDIADEVAAKRLADMEAAYHEGWLDYLPR